MAKSPRAIGLMATMCFALSSALPQPVIAGDDTELAKKLWVQGRELSEKGTAMAVKMEDAFNQEDLTTACYYARESQHNSQTQFDLTLRMSNLDLDPRNMAIVQEQLANTRDALDSVNELVNIPECNAPEEPVYDSTNDDDMKKLEIAAATARKLDTEGRAFFAEERWMLACTYLTVVQSSYSSNSRFALELSERFSAEDNAQPHLAELSAELADMEKAVTPKRDIACKNETLNN